MIVVPSKKERPDLYFDFDLHWNAKGHKWVAVKIVDRLLEDEWLSGLFDLNGASS